MPSNTLNRGLEGLRFFRAIYLLSSSNESLSMVKNSRLCIKNKFTFKWNFPYVFMNQNVSSNVIFNRKVNWISTHTAGNHFSLIPLPQCYFPWATTTTGCQHARATFITFIVKKCITTVSLDATPLHYTHPPFSYTKNKNQQFYQQWNYVNHYLY